MKIILYTLVAISVLTPGACAADLIDLSQAAVVIRPGDLPNSEASAAAVLSEEVQRRTGLELEILTSWPKESQTVIALSSEKEVPGWNKDLPKRAGENLPETQAEGFRLWVDAVNPAAPVVWILGADARGTLFGVGALLRRLMASPGQALVPSDLDLATSPVSPIRGHQLGYRQAANSWDAWTPEQYDQYIRELAIFGANSIENIPFQDDRFSPVMRVPRDEMNREMSRICQRYGLDYWVWTPADFDLNDQALRAEHLKKFEQFFKDCPELSGVFFPGGDPGDNPPELVIPFLKDIHDILVSIHPKAGLWLSMQGFSDQHVDWVYEYLEKESPDWLAGLAGGPSAPPIAETRNRLPKKYKHRLYPDITHNKICQYPVPWWDQAFALTLGRESTNPRPMQYTTIHNWFAPYSDGFISYSDGIHDDVNKTLWSGLGWDPSRDPRDILIEYCRVFFGDRLAVGAADGLFALERNWRGPLLQNGAVDGTLLLWKNLESKAPELETNWRWQQCLMRAYYDAFIRQRLIYETRLEKEANEALNQCEDLGADEAMKRAREILERTVTLPVATDLRARVVELCEDLYHSIGLQTSVEKYHASGVERGAVLDLLDVPVNNRWWLEDEFDKVAGLGSEAEKCARLKVLANWETPGPGSYYDDIGNNAESPHVLRSEEVVTEPGEEAHPEPTLWWLDNGKNRGRLAWQSSMDYPQAVVYEGLDPEAAYQIRMTGFGSFLLSIDGNRIAGPTKKHELGEIAEFEVPSSALGDRKLVLTWDEPSDEGHLNWRQQSRLTEVWLIKVRGVETPR